MHNYLQAATVASVSLNDVKANIPDRFAYCLSIQIMDTPKISLDGKDIATAQWLSDITQNSSNAGACDPNLPDYPLKCVSSQANEGGGLVSVQGSGKIEENLVVPICYSNPDSVSFRGSSTINIDNYVGPGFGQYATEMTALMTRNNPSSPACFNTTSPCPLPAFDSINANGMEVSLVGGETRSEVKLEIYQNSSEQDKKLMTLIYATEEFPMRLVRTFTTTTPMQGLIWAPDTTDFNFDPLTKKFTLLNGSFSISPFGLAATDNSELLTFRLTTSSRTTQPSSLLIVGHGPSSGMPYFERSSLRYDGKAGAFTSYFGSACHAEDLTYV